MPDENIAAHGDRTTRAVSMQIAAMGCASYEIGILDADAGKMLLRTWTVPEVERSIPWLKRMNAIGRDIYIRPDGSMGIILLDDLDHAAIVRLKHDGLAPAVVVETSPGNYQAWLRVSEQPIASEQATMAAKTLAERYGGDPSSADWRHFGRLAGFTNRKPKHRQERGQPFVLVREATGAAAERGAQILEDAAARVQAAAQAHEAAMPMPSGSAPLRWPTVARGRLHRRRGADHGAISERRPEPAGLDGVPRPCLGELGSGRAVLAAGVARGQPESRRAQGRPRRRLRRANRRQGDARRERARGSRAPGSGRVPDGKLTRAFLRRAWPP